MSALVNFYWNSCHSQFYPFPLSQSTASISSLMAPIPNRPNCFPSNRPPCLLHDFYSTTSSRPLPSLCRPQVGLPVFPVLALNVSIYTYPSSFPPNPSFPWFLQLCQYWRKTSHSLSFHSLRSYIIWHLELLGEEQLTTRFILVWRLVRAETFKKKQAR